MLIEESYKGNFLECITKGSRERYNSALEIIVSKSKSETEKLASSNILRKKLSNYKTLNISKNMASKLNIPQYISFSSILMRNLPHFSYGLPKIIRIKRLIPHRIKASLESQYLRINSKQSTDDLVAELNTTGHISRYGCLFFTENLSQDIYSPDLVMRLMEIGVNSETISFMSKLSQDYIFDSISQF